MSYLVDTNIVSPYIRRPSSLAHRILQHSGRLAIPTIVLGELHAWAHRRADPAPLLKSIQLALVAFTLLDFDPACAEEFGRLKGQLGRRGIVVDPADLVIASTALVHGLTLVTHNTADFRAIPGLNLEDWLIP